MNRLLQSLREARTDWIVVDYLLRSDLNWFTQFLEQYNGRSIILTGDCELVIEADSCLTAGGGRMGDKCYHIRYPLEIAQKMHISELELLNCLIAARVFLQHEYNTRVRIICDNSAAVACMSTGRGKDPIMMCICRAFWYLFAARNISFQFKHAPGISMTVADALSRQHLSTQDSSRAADVVRENHLKYVEVSLDVLDYKRYF